MQSADDIEIGFYNKNCAGTIKHFLDIYVDNIDDLLVGGTVHARIGEKDDFRNYPKEILYKYIICGGYEYE